MNKKVDYWLDLAKDDLSVAKTLLKSAHYLHMGFFCHLVIEKSLKAVIANKTNEIPPKIHDLPKLADIGGIWDRLSAEQKNLIKIVVPLQIDARYPEYKERIASALTSDYCEKLFNETEVFLCWIKKLLEK